MKNIISFSARKQSGKSTCCEALERRGYKILNFADELKELCCKILGGISLDELNIRKEIPCDIVLTASDYIIISQETDITFENIVDIFETKVLKSVRELLQVLGTDLIRQFNPNWHINRIRNKIVPGQRYAISDTRFQNEKEFVESIGGETWFIIKPDNITNLSNHLSETELKWNHFENIFINDSTKQAMQNIWNIYHNYKWKPLNRYEPCDIMLYPTAENIYKYKNELENLMKNNNPYIRENLKHWISSSNDNIPDIIRGNKELELIWNSKQ